MARQTFKSIIAEVQSIKVPPKIPDEWLYKKIEFQKPNKKQKYRKFFAVSILYEYNKIPFVIEITYRYNHDFTKWEFISQIPESCYFKNVLFTNYIYHGYHKSCREDIKWKRVTNSYFISYFKIYKASNMIRNCRTFDILNYSVKFVETGYKEGWLKYIDLYFYYGSNNYSSKGHVLLGFAGLGFSKKFFKSFLDNHKKLNIGYKINTYLDYLVIARKKGFDFFDTNWLSIHDEYVNNIERIEKDILRKKKKACIAAEKALLNNNASLKFYDYVNSLKQLSNIGKKMQNCVGEIHKDFKNFYLFKINGENLLVKYIPDAYFEARMFNNYSVDKSIENKIKKLLETKLIKERRMNG